VREELTSIAVNQQEMNEKLEGFFEELRQNKQNVSSKRAGRHRRSPSHEQPIIPRTGALKVCMFSSELNQSVW
jgi:hypothetical protein